MATASGLAAYVDACSRAAPQHGYARPHQQVDRDHTIRHALYQRVAASAPLPPPPSHAASWPPPCPTLPEHTSPLPSPCGRRFPPGPSIPTVLARVPLGTAQSNFSFDPSS